MTATYLGDYTSLVRTVFGRKMYVDTRDTVVSPHLLLDGDWEPWVREFLTHTLQPGMRFVDVGAHLGWYTLLAAHLVHSSGRVVAFDPCARHVELLRRTMMINGMGAASVVEAACSDEDGELPYAIDPFYSGNGRVQAGSSTHVRAIRLDGAVQEADFVKIDAEGHEPRVLTGMMQLLDRSPRIQLLVEHHDPKGSPETFRGELAVLDKLVAMGFRVAVLEHDSHLSEVSLSDLGEVPDSEMLYLARG